MFNKLRLKVTLGTALILGLFLLVLGSYLINSQRLQLIENLRDHGNRIASLAARSSAEYIQRFSFFLMEDQAIAIEQSPHIAFCEIYDANDTPLLQSGNIISKDHSIKNTARYDEEVMVVSQPIVTEQKTLGRVEIGLRLNSIEENIRAKTTDLAFLFTGFTLCVIILLNIFFNKIFINPVRELAEGTQKIAQRQFVTIDVGNRSDEIGVLANNFNEMSQRLRDLYLNLEGKVSQRTRELEKANKDLLAAIEQAKAMARKAEEGTMAKSQFLASMSHEMRTPMNAVLGMGEILHGTDLDEEQSRYVSILLESGNALLDLIDDILDLSKIEAGEMVFEIRPFKLEETIDKTIKVVSYAAHQKGLDLEYMIAPDVPSELEGDPLRLQQILLNLLGNGVKFTDTGSVLLDIRLDDSKSGDDSLIHFSVRDSGIGIRADKLETIFDKFTQADASTTRRHGGTGLGLSICQLLCENLGGTIRIESEFGKGTSVHFVLPYQPHTPDAPVASNLKGKSVLLIDEREYADRALASRLRQAGAQVRLAVSLDDALGVLKLAAGTATPYDTIILNTPLEGKTWGQASAAFIETGIDPKSIYLLLPSDITRTKSLNSFGGVITKPAATHDLEKALSDTESGFDVQETQPDSAGDAASPPLDILLVEDSVANSMLIELYLKDSKHKLTSAENGKAALELFKNNHFDIVLMDIEMPIMDGFECTEKLREWERQDSRPPAKIVALTAHALSEVRDRILSVGCDSFLTKPIARSAFLGVINKTADKPK